MMATEKAHTLQPLSLAIDLALIIMQSGGSTVLADRTFRNVLRTFKMDDVQVTWRMDWMAVTFTGEGEPQTIIRPIGPAALHLVRVTEAATISIRVAREELDLPQLASEISRLKKLPSPYRQPTAVFAAACAAGFFALTAGGNWGSFAIAFVAAAIGQLLRLNLQLRGVNRFHAILACALISGSLVVIALRLGLNVIVPATLIGSIIYMVPGIPLINGFFDAVSGKYLWVGMQRLLDAMVIFIILTIAVALADSLL